MANYISKLALNKTQIPGFNLRVSGKLNLPSEDLGGESSRTDQAEKGNKPKQLIVNCAIRFNDTEDLNTIIKLAEALDNNGERLIYNITNKTAEGMGVRQVQFSDVFTVTESESERLWRCRFTLIEYRSTSEKVEARIEQNKPAVITPAGEAVTGTNTEQDEVLKPEGTVENFLAGVEDIIS